MNREEALKRSDEALQELAAALKQGKSETLVQYLDMLSRFHQYSFGNCMLIYLQMPTASMVAGFHRWKELHRWVKKGEKGIAILAPMIGKRKKSESKEASAALIDGSASDQKVVFGFRTVFVFDVNQTEGKELPEFARLNGDPGELQARLETTIADHGISFSYVDSLGGANGVSMNGRIEVLSSLPPAQKFSTTVHEFAHELLHRGDRREQTDKTVRETEAEAVAYAVCRWAGIDCSTRAADYIQLYTGDEKLLMQSLELIRDAAAKVIGALTSKTSAEETNGTLAEPTLEVAHVN
jgi:hypothetical protein